ncbi:MAG: thioredoxin domain-containing protein [Thermoleophilia bacterium]
MNRLAHETSPYLLQHAENPVDWYPWGEEALARARAGDRPILLSIGYSSCHWCHVMEHESFEDEETAALMNRLFVNVKVDREERPDLDAIYMDAVVALTGHGGWPMTVFLTPDQQPFYGGTYFPPVSRQGMPAFRDVLEAVARAYVERRADVVEQAGRLTDAIRASTRPQPSPDPLTSGILTEAVLSLREHFDPEWGGFGNAPKFPPAPALELLLRLHQDGNPLALDMATTTLDRMADGGMYDQLGGGFHRYSVDRVWLVPHFEKMLYDNALLARAYLHAWLVTGTPRYRQVAEETLDYLLRVMRLPEGVLGSAEDADTDGHEGLTYVWTPDEVGAVLDDPADAALALEAYGITERGNFEGASIPFRAADVDPAALAPVRARLLAARDRRPQPFRDDKALAGWNGLALAALADAGARLERPDYLEAAKAIAGFLLGPMSTPEGRLFRTYRAGEARIPGYLDDYAYVANGLLELYEATGEERWLDEAERLARLALDLFGDPEHGGFYLTPADGEQLVARKLELTDQPIPSGNGVLATVLIRLARLLGDDALERRAVDVLRVAHSLLVRAPSAVCHLLGVLHQHLAPPREVVVAGPVDDPATQALRRVVLARFDPNAVVAFAPGDGVSRVALLDGKGLVGGRPAGYVCQNFACLAPETEPDALAATLAQRPGPRSIDLGSIGR